MEDKTKHRQRNLGYYHQRRAAIIEQLGGRCAVCGSTENLEIDHIHSDDKAFGVSEHITMSMSKVAAELTKCQLLCRSCHIKKTRAYKDSNAKIDEATVRSIREKYAKGNITQKELGNLYNLKQREISNIVRYQRWSDI